LRVFAPRLESESVEPPVVLRRERRYRRLLALGDVTAATLSLLICVSLLGEGDRLRVGALAGIPLIVLITKVLGLYDRDELLLRKTTLEEVPFLFQLATLSALLLWLGQTVLVAGELGRDQVLGFWAALFVLLFVLRVVARSAARRVVPIERVLLIGDPEACERARDKIEASANVHAEVAAQIELRTALESSDAVAALAQVSAECEIHRVVVAPPSTDHGEVLDLIRAAKAVGLKVSVLPRMLEVVGSSVEFEDLDGVNVLAVRRFGLTRSSRLVKRVMDLGAGTLMWVLLLPVLLGISLAVKADSRGPLFFRQRRVGCGGEIFELLKFRTMVADAESQKADLQDLNEAEGLFKIADDPRITRVGRFLRRTSLDELPQLMNVLRGEMSLVGPRPLVLDEDERVEGWYRRRLDLTPGMTGRWQVLGSARVPLQEMVQLDYLYVANWSLWGDVKILLRTLPFVLGRRGL